LSTGASITMSQGDWRGDSVDWNEVCVSMTASVVNDVAANKFFNPEAIALYVGPLFSMLQSSDLEEDNKFGLTVGVEVMVSESLSFDIGVRHFESSGVNGGLHLRF